MQRYYLFFLLIPIYYTPCFISNEVLHRLTKEDGLYESIGAILFLFASIIFFILSAKPNLYNNIQKSNTKFLKFYLLGFAVLFLFAFGEEISWGQRILNYPTPEAIKDINHQNEFNIYNIGIFHAKTSEGIEKTGFISLFTMNRIFYTVFLTYLLFLPLGYKISANIKNLLDKISLPVPHILFGILFSFNLVYAKFVQNFIEDIHTKGIIEIKETVYASIIFGLPLHWINYKNLKISSLSTV